jgi:mannitol-1-/sugar-/sorbitol-6-/2-deoxyglucose-6-phosphatase
LLGRGVHAYVAHFYREQPWEGPSVGEVVQQIIDNQISLVKREGVLKPGALQTLKLCKQAGLPLAVASSSPIEMIDAVVDSLKIRQYFDHIYSGVNEPYSKPHPGVFITTAGLLHAHPYNCLVFEDAPSGVLAAKAARMTCIAVPEPPVRSHPFIQIADVILDSLEEFDKGVLANLNA